MFLGIEIGGTKLQLGLGEGDGKIVALWRGSVVVEAGAPGILRQIQQAVPELLSKANIDRSQLRGVGIGFGGPVDDATRSVIKSHQISGWDDFPLAKWAEEQFGCPAALGNDADVAGLAEALFGAGKGLSPIFYITIGSGIGGGLVINGEIYRGCGRGAAEIGHLNIPTVSSTAEVITVEEISSGWGIQSQAQEWLKATQHGWAWGADSALLKMVDFPSESVRTEHVALAAEQGDRLALMVLEHACEGLAKAISQVIVLLCPRRFVIGGGVALMGETLLFEPLRKLVAQRVFKPFAGCYDIVPAALGEEVVVHGALALAARKASVEP